MAWYDGIPVVGPIVHGIQAEGQPLDTQGIDDARKRAAALYYDRLHERDAVQPVTPQITGSTVTAPTLDDTQAQQVRARQIGALDTLEGAANGTAPSASQAAHAGAVADATGQILGLAGQARGTAAVAARRAAIQASANMRRRAALDLLQGRAGEQATARGQLVGALSNVRGADTDVAMERARQDLAARTSTAGFGQRTSEANQNATLQGTAEANRYRLGLGQEQLGANAQAGDLASRKAQMEEERRRYALGRMDNTFQTIGKGAAQLAG
jgi:hypothetical protein